MDTKGGSRFRVTFLGLTLVAVLALGGCASHLSYGPNGLMEGK